jgi:hypothetical protein
MMDPARRKSKGKSPTGSIGRELLYFFLRMLVSGKMNCDLYLPDVVTLCLAAKGSQMPRSRAICTSIEFVACGWNPDGFVSHIHGL